MKPKKLCAKCGKPITNDWYGEVQRDLKTVGCFKNGNVYLYKKGDLIHALCPHI